MRRRRQKWCVVVSGQPVACGYSHDELAVEAKRLRARGHAASIAPLLTTPPRLRGRHRMRSRAELGGGFFSSAPGKILLGAGVAAAAAAASSAFTIRRAAPTLLKELLAAGTDVSRAADTSCRTAAEAQVWTTLASVGLTRERVAAIRRLVERGETPEATAAGVTAGAAASAAAAAIAAARRAAGGSSN